MHPRVVFGFGIAGHLSFIVSVIVRQRGVTVTVTVDAGWLSDISYYSWHCYQIVRQLNITICSGEKANIRSCHPSQTRIFPARPRRLVDTVEKQSLARNANRIGMSYKCEARTLRCRLTLRATILRCDNRPFGAHHLVSRGGGDGDDGHDERAKEGNCGFHIDRLKYNTICM